MAELLYYNLTKEMPPSLGHRQIALSDLLQLQEGRSADVARSALDAELAAGPPKNRRRRDRTHFSDHALSRLEEEFTVNQYPDIVCREELASELEISEARIQVWFQNRRSRLRRCKKGVQKPRSREAKHRVPTEGATVARRPAAESSSLSSSSSPPHTGQLQCQGRPNTKLFRPFLDQESSPTRSEESESSISEEGGTTNYPSFDKLYGLGSSANRTTTAAKTTKVIAAAPGGFYPYGTPYAYQAVVNPHSGSYYLHPFMGYDTLSLITSPKLVSPLANRAFVFPTTQTAKGKENTPPTGMYMNYSMAASINQSFLPLDRLPSSTSSATLDQGAETGTTPRGPSPGVVQGSEGVSSTETLSSECSSPAYQETVENEAWINVCD